MRTVPSLIHYRPPDWSRDLAALEALDLSMTVAQVYEVRAESRCFCLHTHDCRPPLEKSYDVDWSELATSGRCLVATRDERVIGFGALDVTIPYWRPTTSPSSLY